MQRLLIATVVWCPADQPVRAATIRRHLDQLARIAAAHPFVDIHVVANDVVEPTVLEAMAPFDAVEHHRPQVGWARGRNRAMRRFRDDPRYDRLAMTDCDQCWDDLSWPATVMALAASEPSLHAYMLRVDKWQRRGTARLPTGTVVDVYDEWYGTTNIIDREVIEQVGALNVADFPQDWGFHDCEWGRRLRRAGLLRSTGGHFVDPIRLTGDLGHDDAYDASMTGLKNACIQTYLPVFRAREREIEAGQRIRLPLDDAV